MTTRELEELLQGGGESQRVDFKASCEWHAASMAKDILALANVQDGGFIVIGMAEEEHEFHRQGITDEHRLTYVVDTMRDQVSPFADPHVIFNIDFPVDESGIRYGVIQVMPFEVTPVICRRDANDARGHVLLQAGKLYYRNRNRRSESAPISNSHDLRDILDRASVNLMTSYLRLGLVPREIQPPRPPDIDRLNAELDGL